MKKSRAIVLTGNGTNCEVEAAHACRLGGFDEVEIVHVVELLKGRVSLHSFHFLNLTGGFLDGDDLGSARAQAVRLRHARVSTTGERLLDQFERFIRDGKLILGVCNGFQLMTKMGLLPALDHRYFVQSATLAHNDSGRFEDRWCRLAVDPESPSVYTKGMTSCYLPVRHGEGKFIAPPEILDRMDAGHLVPLRYADEKGEPTLSFPENPNGSLRAIAGVCDPTGRLMGLMPHPEAFLHRTNHPRWTRESLPEEGDGLHFFINASQFVKEHLL